MHGFNKLCRQVSNIFNAQYYPDNIFDVRTTNYLNIFEINNNKTLFKILNLWSLPYIAISLMNNYETSIHQNNRSGYIIIDQLIMIREYQNCWLKVSGLEYFFYCNSRTVIALYKQVILYRACYSR